MGTPKPKLRYLEGGPPPKRRPRLLKPGSRPPCPREVPSYPRSFSLSTVLHSLAVCALLVLLPSTDAMTFSGESAESSVVAMLERRPAPEPAEAVEQEYEVEYELIEEEPVLIETPIEVQPEPETFEPAPTPVDWMLPSDPTAQVTEASWKLYPAALEVPAETEIVPPVLAEPVPPPPPRIGDVAAPTPVENPTPSYPRKALRLRWEGTVRLRIQVDASGVVRDVELVESSGHDVLDEAAIAGFHRWVFQARKAGEPELRRFVKSFRFSLD